MKHLEIEKRFLVPSSKIAELMERTIAGTQIDMEDFYVPNGSSHKDLRLRRQNHRFEITRKRPIKDGDTTTMLETTIPLSEPEFKALSEGIKTKVAKTRCQIDFDDWRGELDIFSGEHTGLAVLEFEFQNPADLADFEQKADLNLPDITNLEWLAGGKLAETNQKTLKTNLKSLKS